MASSKEYLEFILGQLSELEEITYRAMMGEFIIYSNFAHRFSLCTLKIQYLAAIQLSMFSQLCRLQFRF